MTFKYILYKEDAVDLGLKFFSSGRPCSNGHESVRYTKTHMCLECRRMFENARIAKNPEKHAAKSRAYYAKNPEKCRARAKAHKDRNPDIHKARAKEWRTKNPERHRQNVKNWRIENPESIRLHANNRRARKMANGGIYSVSDITNIFKMQRGKCAYCRIKLNKKRHIDHIIPLAKGGSNWPENLQLLCAPCNQTKHTADPIVFAQSLGMLL